MYQSISGAQMMTTQHKRMTEESWRFLYSVGMRVNENLIVWNCKIDLELVTIIHLNSKDSVAERSKALV